MEPATYTIEFTRRAARELSRIPNPDHDRIAQRIRSLATDPRPEGCKKLQGAPGYRIRQGNYRIIYLINDDTILVAITRVAHRGRVYE